MCKVFYICIVFKKQPKKEIMNYLLFSYDFETGLDYRLEATMNHVSDCEKIILSSKKELEDGRTYTISYFSNGSLYDYYDHTKLDSKINVRNLLKELGFKNTEYNEFIFISENNVGFDELVNKWVLANINVERRGKLFKRVQFFDFTISYNVESKKFFYIKPEM